MIAYGCHHIEERALIDSQRSPKERALTHFIRYVIAGTLAVSVQFSILTLLVEVFSILPTLASGVGFICGCSTNYMLQYYWTFRSKGDHFSTACKYALVNSITLCINLLIFWTLTNLLGVWYIISQGMAICVVVFINFFANRHFTFQHD